MIKQIVSYVAQIPHTTSCQVSLGRTETGDGIHFLLQKKGINKDIQILSLHHITYCMMSNANTMISYTTLRKVVRTNTF